MAVDAIHRSWEVNPQVVYYHIRMLGTGAADPALVEGDALDATFGTLGIDRTGVGEYDIQLNTPVAAATPIRVQSVQATGLGAAGVTLICQCTAIVEGTRTFTFSVYDEAGAAFELTANEEMFVTIVTRESLAGQ